jgi:hypothetical protein
VTAPARAASAMISGSSRRATAAVASGRRGGIGAGRDSKDGEHDGDSSDEM